MDKILDIISRWDGLGQGVFLFLCFLLLAATVQFCFRMVAVWLHGWPTYEDDESCEMGDN